jgi:uncharacterized membrane protein
VTEQPLNPSPITRWVLPLAIVWAEFLLSAFVFTRLPKEIAIDPARALVMFLSMPVLTLLGFLVFRFSMERSAAERTRSEDLIVVWIVCFLFGVHALVLALAIGMIASLQHAMPIAICVLFVGLGPVLARLEPKSAMGIRTKATLASDAAWAKVHRTVGRLFPLAGAIGLSALWLHGWPLIFASVAPALLAILAGVLYGVFVRV